MEAVPYRECLPTVAPFDALVGRSIGTGWRRVINEAMGGALGCTHLRELLGAMGHGSSANNQRGAVAQTTRKRRS